MTQPSNTGLRRLPELDGLRGLAIHLVIFYHYLPWIIPSDAGFPLSTLKTLGAISWSGVDLFFVLSGYLIGGILLDNRNAANYFGTFYRRRFLRILPLYGVMLAAFILLRAPLAEVLDRQSEAWLFDGTLPLWSYATLTQNIATAVLGPFGATWLGVTWSLAVEEQFYIVLPLIVRFCPYRRLPLLICACIVAAPIFRVLVSSLAHSNIGAYVLMPSRGDSLMLGVLCAYAMRNFSIEAWLKSHRPGLKMIFAGLLVGVVVFSRFSFNSRVMITVGYSWLALTYACLLLLAVTSTQGRLHRLLIQPVLVQSGIIAYGLYLLHIPMLGILSGILLGYPPQFLGVQDAIVVLISLVLSITLATGSWKFFERHFVEIGHRYRYYSQSA